MYEMILNFKLLSLVIALVLSWLAGVLVGQPIFSLRPIIYNYGPPFASSFFILAIFYEGSVNTLDLASGFIFEFLILLVFTKLFYDLAKYRCNIDCLIINNWLRLSLVFQILIAFPLITSEGYGIFSEGSRNDYLFDNRAMKYFVYIGLLNSTVQAFLVAQWFSILNKNLQLGYVVIVITFVLSTLSGSKGGFFLWIASVFVLVDFSRKRIMWAPVITGIMLIALALISTSVIISEMLNITPIEFIELSAARFFLNNDARALAFDMRNGAPQIFDLLASTFRGVFMFFGYVPEDPPLGILLHDRLFGFSSGSGANASLIALITYYSIEGYALFATLIACFVLILVYLCIVSVRERVNYPMHKSIVTVIGLLLVQIFSQDFLAFPLLLPFACLAGFILIIADRKYVYANPK